MIVLFTDFGWQGPYVGQMKAVLHAHAPGVAVIDLLHDAPAFNPRASAYLLPAYAAAFPPDSIFLCVVDPGVGSERKACVICADKRWFVGPDNGLFNEVARRAKRLNWYEVSWQPQYLSATFHGRDLFAPVAAMIAANNRIEAQEVDAAAHVRDDWPKDLEEVVYIDAFGNCITGMRAEHAPRSGILVAGDHRLRFVRTFADVGEGMSFWYENANGLVEIAVNRGSAAALLHLHVGAPVRWEDAAAA